MKKRIFMLLMTMAMVLGMSLTVFADEVKYYEVTGNIYLEILDSENGRTIIHEATNGLLEYGSDYRYFTFSTSKGEHSLLVRIEEVSEWQTDWQYSEFDGVFYGYRGDGYDPFPTINGELEGWKIAASDISGQGYYMALSELIFTEVESPTEPTIQQVSTGFIGMAVSDRGDYNLYIAGYFRKDLTNGTHALALSDISSQTIAVIAHNNANGVNRNMNQSTIEEMTVTVSGGVVTEMIIRGRVQTDGGTLDRYTATINP